jgi:hypothetical protein
MRLGSEGDTGRMLTRASYRLRRITFGIWSWEVRLQERVIRDGFALTQPGARWMARSIIRALRQGPVVDDRHTPAAV